MKIPVLQALAKWLHRKWRYGFADHGPDIEEFIRSRMAEAAARELDEQIMKDIEGVPNQNVPDGILIGDPTLEGPFLRITRDGSMEMRGRIDDPPRGEHSSIRGEISAPGGQIGGWDVQVPPYAIYEDSGRIVAGIVTEAQVAAQDLIPRPKQAALIEEMRVVKVKRRK